MIGIRYHTPPAAPGDNETVVLYSHDMLSPTSTLEADRVFRVIINFLSVDQASAASGLKAYARATPTGTWRQVDFDSTMPMASSATSAGVDIIHDFEVATYPHFKIEYTAGATGPTTWELLIVSLRGVRDTGR